MLWGNIEYPSGNQKPVFANTTNTTATSTIHGGTVNSGANAANSIGVYGAVFGISALEAQTANLLANTSPVHKVIHAGWVSQKIGTGPITSIIIATGGAGINTSGYLSIVDNSGRGRRANASWSIANSQNLAAASSSNSTQNVMSTITINDGGVGFVNANSIVINTLGVLPTVNATYQVVLGGRAGRVQYETIVAMGSITGDDPRDNVAFGAI